jgi:histidinol-phosphatase (PHP family)
MMQVIQPEVVGHFDLVRLHDPNYAGTLAEKEIRRRILRNLEWVRESGAVLDVNARAFLKRQREPYVCSPIMETASAMGILLAYGDDSHGTADVGFDFDMVASLLGDVGLLEVKSCAVQTEPFFSRPTT